MRISIPKAKLNGKEREVKLHNLCKKRVRISENETDTEV
jgi:hypothetical protein